MVIDHEESINYMETYSPVVKTATVILVLDIAISFQWDIKQLDVTLIFFMVSSQRLSTSSASRIH